MIPELGVIPRPRGCVADMLEAKGSLVYSIGPREMVFEAVVKMNEHQVGALLVMEGPSLLGILSERDYTRKITLLGRSSKETRVEEIMSPDLVTVDPATGLGECLHTVTRRRIRHLPVLKDGQVVGVVSIGDLVLAVVAQQAETIETLQSIIGSDYPN